MKLSKNNYKENNNCQKIPKRKEWLIYSKGFIVESINNNYINQNIKIKKLNKKEQNNNKNIIPRNLTNISKTGIKSNISKSNYSSKKTNFSIIIDNIEDNFCNKNKLLISDITIKSENKSNKKNNKKDNEKKVIEKKEINQNNTFNDIDYIKQEKKEKKKNKNKSVKMKPKLSLKKAIKSPLLNYIEARNKDISQSLFYSINNSNKKDHPEKNIFNLYNNGLKGKTAKKESNSKENIFNIINKKNKKKRNKVRYSQSVKEITINNINLIEIHKFMVEGRKFKGRKSNYKSLIQNKNSFKDLMGDYSYDDEVEEVDKIIMSERKNRISFSEICSSTNNYMTNKKEFSSFFGQSNKTKENLKINLIKANKI